MEAQQLNLQLLEGGITKQRLSTQKYKTTETIPGLEVGQKLAELIGNQEPISTKVLSEIMTAAYRGTDAQGKWIWKNAYEALELGTVLYLQERGIKYLSDAPYQALQNLIEWQSKFPTHTKRSEDTYNYQQFSTPLPMSFLVAQAAGITRNDIVLEPSAGNGMLAIWAHLAGAKLILNELHQQRQQNLTALFPQAAITGFNGEQIHDWLNPNYQPTVVVMNPPFSRTPKVGKRSSSATARHVESALWRLQPGGRLVTITANWFSPHNPDWSEYFQKLGRVGYVAFSAGIEGKAYAKHGTNIETRLTVIERTPRTGFGKVINDCLSLTDLLSYIQLFVPERMKQESEVRSQKSEVRKQGEQKSEVRSQKSEGRIADHTVIPFPTTVPARESGNSLLPIAHSLLPAPSDAPETAPPKLRLVQSEETIDLNDIVEVQYSLIEEHPEEGELNDGIYERYQPQTIKIEGAKKHPTPLVEATAMASIKPPVPDYKPHLPRQVIEGGILSDAQIEAVIYAGQAHQEFLSGWYLVDETLDSVKRASQGDEGAVKFRKSYFNGDGTGVGKGRQVSGIILDNWLKGRTKAVWVSHSSTLIEDARRDWKALGGDENQIVSLSKYKQGTSVDLTQGIIFTTYATLRSTARQGKASRLEQLVEWFGKDSDGVVVFDESHALANAVSEKAERGIRKASQQGIAGLRLQRALPNARFLFVSATGATKLSNLGYLERLGLWGTDNFPFRSREAFLAGIGSGGVAALEVVSRDLKALGLYIARSLSFDGVNYEIVEHKLSEPQEQSYNEYARAYQIIHSNISEALGAANVRDARTKSNAYAAFENAKQRFFQHILTSFKCPTLIKSIERDLAEGNAAVIQLVSTDEALLERRLAEIPASQYNDIQVDITPREYLFDYLMSAFPTQLHEIYTDEEGEERSRPVVDKDGNPVHSQQALQQREELIERLALLPPVPSALDQIIHHFGHDKVAEITGRSQRIVREVNGEGDKLKLQKRSSRANVAETNAFMNDEKQILVFSQAGGTGRSYHADLGAANQRLRRHYLLQSGFRADLAVQGLGRTNRSNQAQPPVFCVITTNVKAERRFISTISSRLDSLGALTKGERKTGGQGLFRQDDNLESIYAKTALRQFYVALGNLQIEGLDMERFQEVTGLKLLGEGGSLKEVLPPMKQFLNRCLAMELDDQKLVFDALELRITSNIEAAMKAGDYEVGVETLQAESFKVLERKPLYTHENGAVSTIVKIERQRKQEIVTLAQAEAIGKAFGKFCVNERSGLAAVVSPTTSRVEESGEVVSRVILIGPTRNQKLDKGEFTYSKWKEVPLRIFTAAWNQEADKIPEFKTDHLFLITGLLLPIWNRLDASRTQIYRLQTDAGERLLGRVVTAGAISEVAARFDVCCGLSGAEIVEAARSSDKSVAITDNLKLQRSRVADSRRLEIVGFDSAELRWLKTLGVFSEYVQHRLRAFVPNDASAMGIVERIIAAG